MDYLLKASAVLLIFYACYQLFLQRETFFQANRWFLLLGLVLASCIPLIVIPVYIEYTLVETSGFTYAVNNSATSIPAVVQEQSFNYNQLIIWAYLAGILIFFGKLCIELLSLRKVLKNSRTKSSEAFKIMETTESVAPFSFFNRIVYNPNQFKNEELAHVINHEKVHTKELHSIDTIIAQFACILFWFNPIVWLYKKALQQNLEFIADQKAQYVSHCEKSYQTVLLKASVKNHQLAFTNNFYTSLIKKRIVMLHKSKSNKLNQLKFILVLPVLALFMMSFNTKDVYVEAPSKAHIDPVILEIPQTDDIEIVITKDTTDDQLKELQDKLKSKGVTFNYKSIKRNSKGEITSIKTDFKNAHHSSNYNINGDDGIKAFRFKSSDDTFSLGTIDKGNTYVFETTDGIKVKGQSTGSNVYVIEEEGQNNTIHELKNVTYATDSIVYEQAKGQNIFISTDKTRINASENGSTNFIIRKSDEPIFIIDGSAVDKSIFENVDSDNIKSINILKGKSAIELYGQKGQNGVVIMSTKGSKNVFINKDKSKGIILKSDNLTFTTDGKKPLFIIDGKVISEDQFRSVSPDNIMSIDVIKDEKALEIYGEKGKNGVIKLITTKSGVLSVKNKPIVVEGHRIPVVVEGYRTPVVVEVEETNPRVTNTRVTGVYYFDEKYNNTAELVISKTSTDDFLDQQKKALKKQGIDAKFNKVRRNKAGEITGIKITLNDNQGRKTSSSWKEKDQAIPDIVMGKSKNDKLYIRTIGNY